MQVEAGKAVNNYAKTIGINQDSLRKTGTFGNLPLMVILGHLGLTQETLGP